MLTNEQAREELRKLENKAWGTSRMAAVETLPANLRDTARTILKAQDAVTYHTLPEARKRRAETLELFVKLEASARLQFFETMAPGLGMAIENGWQLMDRLPYLSGHVRKPFRVPGHPETLIEQRVDWVLDLICVTGPYPPKLAWLAAWAPHLTHYRGAETLGILFAGAIDAGGEEGEDVFQILCASARNEHEIGGMGRHVTRALLSAARPEGWQVVENMLLAAQREEGLRQVILETVDEAHPQAFRRMLKLILEHNLARFSATVRAFDTWLGYQWEAASAGVVNQTIEKLLRYLDDKAARTAALQGAEAEQVYLALWSVAFDNAVTALTAATELLKHPAAEHRFVAVHLLTQLNLLEGQKSLVPLLADADLRVAMLVGRFWQRGADERVKKSDLFERLEMLLDRCPAKPEALKAAVWPWTAQTISKETVADILPRVLAERPANRLIPYLDEMSPRCRVQVIDLLGRQDSWETATRDTLFALAGDASRQVREMALKHLGKCTVMPAEAVAMEGLLDRKTADLRRGALILLAGQADEAALASADRLLAAKSQPQRLAGLELLRQLVENKRCVAPARTRAEHYAGARPKLAEAEKLHLEAVLAAGAEVPTLFDALGLIKHDERTWPSPPVARAVQFYSATSERIIQELDRIWLANVQQTVSYKTASGETWKGLLADIQHGFPRPESQKLPDEDRERLPLAATWENWWQTRGADLRDADGCELWRALARFDFFSGSAEILKGNRQRYAEAIKTVFGEVPEPERKQRWHIRNILHWLIRLHPPAGTVDFILDAAESALSLVPKDRWMIPEAEAGKLERARRVMDNNYQQGWQEYHQALEAIEPYTGWRETASPFTAWLRLAGNARKLLSQAWTPAQQIRHWQLWRWLDEPVRPPETGGVAVRDNTRCLPRSRGHFGLLCRAYEAGGTTEADVIEQLLIPGDAIRYYAQHTFYDLGDVSRRKLRPEYSQFDFLPALVERCRERILEVELKRGDTPTAASGPALKLGSVAGVPRLAAILRALGKRLLVRGSAADDESMETVFSHLVRCSFPRPGETAADFQRAVTAAGIGEERLVELAVYAPQWAGWVEETLGWKQLTEAVWWFHAHTKGTDWTVANEIREVWQADISARTSLSAADLLEGGVDVAWFHRIYQTIGAKRWEAVYAAAKFASTGAGHARARLFADAMLGDISKRELGQRVTKKRQQDAVRALGLLPLAAGAKRAADLLDRYKVIQEFRRTSKQFGSQRQASEKRAAQIGQQNLARTAGYADPIRLEWAMEAKAVEDLADGPITVTVEEVTVSLGIDPWGDIELSVTKAGKVLADIPAALKKNPKVAALRERKVELKRQAARIRPSLEQFMVRGDGFTGVELRELMAHPLLAPMLKHLVIVGEGIAGYPVHDGQALEKHDGQVEAIKADEQLRIAHPHDLLPAAEWHRWQKDCFARERIQPFKQVFRELYPLTETERAEGIQTRRYAGHQVQPRQALALLGQRGWVHHPEEGIRKVYHEPGLVAWLNFQEGFFTPAEIEGLTLESVYFTKRGEHQPLKLAELPPQLFSETMRDLDLVVSVAHRGGVDPEASASTVEMRAALVQETVRRLQLKNVQLKDRYVLIKGELGEYSVHLGSAVTRKMPGEVLFLVPVHSQHLGRLFLPFADDDPRTAEVMSKVLLLARDGAIKDSNILDQIRRG